MCNIWDRCSLARLATMNVGGVKQSAIEAISQYRYIQSHTSHYSQHCVLISVSFLVQPISHAVPSGSISNVKSLGVETEISRSQLIAERLLKLFGKGSKPLFNGPPADTALSANEYPNLIRGKGNILDDHKTVFRNVSPPVSKLRRF